MNQITLLHKQTLSTFFPRIIREFEEKDEPMMYGDY
jgi:hypothetical protein